MAVSISRVANPAGVTADVGFNTTYSGLSVGTNCNLIVLTIGKEVATVVANSATIDDGVSGVRSMNLIGGTTFGSMGAWMYRAAVDNGSSTIAIVVNWSGAITDVQNHIRVYKVVDGAAPQSYSGTNTSTDMDVTVPLTTGSTTIVTDGGMLAVAVGAAGADAKTWANLTVDLDASVGNFRMTNAISTTAGTATRTCTGGTTGEDGVLVWAHFTDSSEPELNMMRYRPT